jgi:hypothetical protein
MVELSFAGVEDREADFCWFCLSFSEVADVDLIAQEPQVLDGKAQVEVDVDGDSDLGRSAGCKPLVAAM